MILGIDHIDIRVPDVDAAIEFYLGGLGFELKRRDSHNGMISTPDGVFLEISPNGSDGWDENGITRVAYGAQNVSAAFHNAVKFGASPLRAPETDADSASVRAPSGEEISFIFRPNAPAQAQGNIHSLLQVGMTVPDVPASMEFYRKLGAAVTAERSLLLPDDRKLVLNQGTGMAGEPKAYSHISLLTDHVDRDLARIVELGGRVLHEPYDWSNLRIAFASGLGGEVIEFFYFYQDGREPDIFLAPPIPLSGATERGMKND